MSNVVKFRSKKEEKPDEALTIYLMGGDKAVAIITPEGDFIIVESINEIYHWASQAGKFAGLFRAVANLSNRIEHLESTIEEMKSAASRNS